ncbi:MDR family MFS transporter [Streptomyces sp. NPDC057136]|uniref:MDR family MFS transporter n=1 Tax=Streptomyces sp. NPDC057136 TaxID=3346029 RepID=UPI00362B7427
MNRPPSADDTPRPDITPRQIRLIIAGLMLSMFLSSLDQTIVSTSMRTIADDLQGLDVQAWVSTAYLVALAVTTPLYGKLSDIYGRKPFFIGAISVFIVGSIACAYADSMYQLAAFRGLQGVGAGGLVTLGLTIIADIVPPRDRPKYQGAFFAVWGTSSVLGPLLGGLLSGQSEILGITGWRWVFLVNAPTGILALIVVSKVLKLPHQRSEHRIDWWGAALLPLCVVPVLVVAEQGDDWGWDSIRSIACYVLGGVSLIAFLLIERRMKHEALIPLRLFTIPTFRMSMVTAALVGVGMFGGIVLAPQYLQIARGASPTEAGLMTLPLMLGIMIGSIISGGGIARSGRYKIFTVVGAALTAIGLGLFYTVEVDTPLWQPLLFMGIFGLGLGNCMQTLTAAAQNAVPVRAMGLGTALVTFFRQIGGSLGVAALLSVLFHTVGGNITDSFKAARHDPDFLAAMQDPAVHTDPDNAPFFKALDTGDTGHLLSDSSFLEHLDPRLARPFRAGFTESIDLVFLIAACVLVLGFVAALMIKEVPIRTAPDADEVTGTPEEDAPEAEGLELVKATAGAPSPATENAGDHQPQRLSETTMQLRFSDFNALGSPDAQRRVPDRDSLGEMTMQLRIVAAAEEASAPILLPRRMKNRTADPQGTFPPPRSE